MNPADFKGEAAKNEEDGIVGEPVSERPLSIL